MSQWSVQLVIGKLVADEAFRRRFEGRAHQALTTLCEQGVDLSDAEMAAFLEMNPCVWAAMADCIDRRLRTTGLVTTAPPAWNAPDPLTSRQSQVLRGIFEGRTNKQIAADIGISESAVKATLQHLFRKTHAHNRAQLVRAVIEGSPVATS